MKHVKFIGLFVACLCYHSALLAQGVDYNRIDPGQRDVAAQGLAQLNNANKEWFSAVCAQHPDGSFDPIWAKRLLLNKFGIPEVQQFGDLLTLMMAYQRMLIKGERKNSKKEKQADKLVKNEELNSQDPQAALVTGLGGGPVITSSEDSGSGQPQAPRIDPVRKNKDTDRSSKGDRALIVQDATAKLLAQLLDMKSCARF